jgi:hypothetical protein
VGGAGKAEPAGRHLNQKEKFLGGTKEKKLYTPKDKLGFLFKVSGAHRQAIHAQLPALPIGPSASLQADEQPSLRLATRGRMKASSSFSWFQQRRASIAKYYVGTSAQGLLVEGPPQYTEAPPVGFS